MRNLRLSPVKVGLGACLLLLLFLSFSQAKRSACWRYGHSCWGGHGKRSGGLSLSGENRPPFLPAFPQPKPLWLSYLLQKMKRGGKNPPQQDFSSKEEESSSSTGESEFGVDNSIFVRARKELIGNLMKSPKTPPTRYYELGRREGGENGPENPKYWTSIRDSEISD